MSVVLIDHLLADWSVVEIDLAANGGASFGGSATLTAEADIAASGGVTLDGSATLTTRADIAAFGSISFDGTATLTSTVLLTATGGMQWGGRGVLSTGIIIEGTVVITDRALATLTPTDRALATLTPTDSSSMILTLRDNAPGSTSMSTHYYTLGSVAEILCVLTNDADALTDSETISLLVKLPSGEHVGPFVPLRLSTGTYQYNYEPTVKGYYAYRVVTANPNAAAEGTFSVVSAF